MNVKLFVTGSSAVLAVWLGVTYVREVPGENYPQLGRGSVPLTAQVSDDAVAPVLDFDAEHPEVVTAE